MLDFQPFAESELANALRLPCKTPKNLLATIAVCFWCWTMRHHLTYWCYYCRCLLAMTNVNYTPNCTRESDVCMRGNFAELPPSDALDLVLCI